LSFIRSLQLGEDDDMRCALRIVASLAFEAMNDRGLRVGIWAEHLVPFVHLATPEVRVAILAAAAYSAQGQHNVEALGEYGVTLKILGTVRAPDQWAAAGELRKRLLAAFHEHGIEIPRPQRVVLAREPGALPSPEESLAAGAGDGLGGE
jgi:small-conductance mechanosensitive channel